LDLTVSSAANGGPRAFETIEKKEDLVLLRVDTNLYARESLFRACYQFTDRGYFFLRPDGDHAIVVELRPKPSSPPIDEVTGEFSNELLSQQVRTDISRETRAIREMIVAQAFKESDLHAG
jgi:His-Xaa-Ser system protein HxsD